MKKLVFVILTLGLFFIACRKDKIPKYDLKIPRNKMVAIMVDLHVAEIAIQEYPQEQQDSIKMIYVTQIFEIHKTDKKLFEENYASLLKKPVLNSNVQSEVLDSIKVLNLKNQGKS
jgi:hypothetical protein